MVVVTLEAKVNCHTTQSVHVGGVTDSHGVVEGPIPTHHGTDFAATGGYDVRLLAVTPYPTNAGTPPDTTEYKVQLLVRESDISN